MKLCRILQSLVMYKNGVVLMKFACYVLSLFDQHDRRESIIGQLEHLLSNYDIIDAVDFRSVSLEKKLEFVKKMRRQ